VPDDQLLTELERVYTSKLDDFVRAASAICGSRETGRDAVHDAFVSLVRARSSFRRESPLEAWVWRAVVNAASRAARRAPSLPAGDARTLERAANGTTAEAVAELDVDAVRAAVAALPERQRLTLFLRYYADLDYQQIADVLEIQRGTVSASLHAAHASLRQTLEEALR
jgi:RNA polymerase sigma-70 factor, ECF subfamily